MGMFITGIIIATFMAASKKILFVCVENAGRSQIAEAFARRLGIDAVSAGTVPASKVNEIVVSVMRKRGIDISSRRPKLLTGEMIDEADLVVTMGCSVEEVCPRPLLNRLKKNSIDWHIDDPKGKTVDEVGRICDEIEEKVLGLFRELQAKPH